MDFKAVICEQPDFNKIQLGDIVQILLPRAARGITGFAARILLVTREGKSINEVVKAVRRT